MIRVNHVYEMNVVPYLCTWNLFIDTIVIKVL
jgi:hypothetical protein